MDPKSPFTPWMQTRIAVVIENCLKLNSFLSLAINVSSFIADQGREVGE